MNTSEIYKLSPDEYWNMLLQEKEAVDEEDQEYYMQEITRMFEAYKKIKSQYDNLSIEEKLKQEALGFSINLKQRAEEINKLEYLLQHYAGHEQTEKLNIEVDEEFIIQMHAELITRYKEYKNMLDEKLKQKIFNPPLTEEEIHNIIIQMINYEYKRINQNAVNYSFFMKLLLGHYKHGNIENIENQEFIKNCILMFLYECDFESNPSKYEQVDLHEFDNIKIISRESVYQNGSLDTMTIKARNRNFPKILRDASSHGEFYNMKGHSQNSDEKSYFVIVQNSEVIPRITFAIPYRKLKNFILSNLSGEIKQKYPFLIKLANSDNLEDIVYSENGITQEMIKEIMVMMLYNIIQYNTEHHFKYADMHETIDVSKFTFTDMENNGQDITQELPQLKKLMNIKNAIGHDNISWNGEILELVNSWISNRGKSVNIKTKIYYNELLYMLMNQNLYTASITSIDLFNQKNNSSSLRA